MIRGLLVSVVFLLASSAGADGPKDNNPGSVRPIPPEGIELSEEDRSTFLSALESLEVQIEELRRRDDGRIARLLPDVEIFSRAVRQAIDHRELFDDRDRVKVQALLKEGTARAEALARGESPWTRQTGLVVRGFRSQLDDTVQPYGLLVPEDYDFDARDGRRLDVWLHGRGERVVEVQFIHQRMTQTGPIAPTSAFVLHPFGRYSNAFKFAGEVDVFEALEHARREYRIDENLIAIRGFSMGGAGCWHLAVHHPDRWFAATPGAGFSETPEFLRTFQGESLAPRWWEKRLWLWYDCPPWVANLRHCPTIAYSGEIDRQKQAADVMVQAFRNESINELELVHVIGPQTGHKIHPDSLVAIEERLERIAQARRAPFPRRVRLQTYTLKYNSIHWITVNALDEHWALADVDARIDPFGRIEIYHRNVRDLTVTFPPGSLGFDFEIDQAISPLTISFFDAEVERLIPLGNAKDPRLRIRSDGSFECRFVRYDGRWEIGGDEETLSRGKRHNLQGPIDDAFMGSFLFVTSDGEPMNEQVGAFVESELNRAVREWRRQMRGDVRIRPASELTADDVARHHLILWGDPQSNPVLRRIIGELPVEWTAESVTIGETVAEGGHHVPLLIAPNPENPERYVVLNSGFTYREYDYLNNARQTPKLPDWAIVDTTEPPGPQRPGRIVAADFFDEQWQPRPVQAQETSGR